MATSQTSLRRTVAPAFHLVPEVPNVTPRLAAARPAGSHWPPA